MSIVDFLISSAHATGTVAPTQTPGAGPLWLQPLLILLMFAAFYFLLIRPQRKRQKEHQEMVNTIQKGNEVATHSGILGKVKSVSGDYIVLQVADNVELKFQKNTVSVVLPKGTIKDIV